MRRVKCSTRGVKERSNPNFKLNRRFMISSTFNQHGWCGEHKQKTIAKDIHKDTKTHIYHTRLFDKREGRNNTICQDFLLPHTQHAAPRKKRKLNSSTGQQQNDEDEQL